MASFYNLQQHPLVPAFEDDGIPEISTDEPSLSVLSDDCTTSDDWVVSLNATPSPPLIQPISESDENVNLTVNRQVYSYSTAQDDESDIDNESEVPTPLEFPTHNGSGSFTDRINEWRLDQSELVLRELRRFERDEKNNRVSTPESVVASWSLGDDQDSDKAFTIWRLFDKVSEFIGMTDQVRGICAGEYYIDPSSSSGTDEDTSPHYNRAILSLPNWDNTVINEVFCKLHIPRPFWHYFGFLFDHGHHQQQLPQVVIPPTTCVN